MNGLALRHSTCWIGLAVAASLVACATVDPTDQLEAVQELEAERGGHEIVWEQQPDDQALIAERVAALLEGGLTRDDAAAIAVLNNRALQAKYEDLGLAAADVVQAGLPSNPTLRGSLLFPVSAGDSSLGIMAWLSDLWLIPRRKGLAVLEATTTELDVARAVLATAHEATSAWDGVVLANKMAQLEQEREEILRHQSDLVRQLYDQGLVSKVDWTNAREKLVEQRVAVRESEHAITHAGARLAVALSLQGAAEHVPDDLLLEIPEGNVLPTAALVEEGLSRRLDLMESRVAVELAARRIDLEHALVWRSVSVGLAYEGDFESVATDGQNPIGPTVAIQLPAFDQNQAGIAAADYRLRQSRKMLAAAYLAAREEIVTAASAYRKTADQLALIEEELTGVVAMEELHARKRLEVGEGDYFEMLSAAMARLTLEAMRLRMTHELNAHQLLLEKALVSG